MTKKMKYKRNQREQFVPLWPSCIVYLLSSFCIPYLCPSGVFELRTSVPSAFCSLFVRCAQQHTFSFKSHKFRFYTIMGGVSIIRSLSSPPLLLNMCALVTKNLIRFFFLLSFKYCVFMLFSLTKFFLIVYSELEKKKYSLTREYIHWTNSLCVLCARSFDYSQ